MHAYLKNSTQKSALSWNQYDFYQWVAIPFKKKLKKQIENHVEMGNVK